MNSTFGDDLYAGETLVVFFSPRETYLRLSSLKVSIDINAQILSFHRANTGFLRQVAGGASVPPAM